MYKQKKEPAIILHVDKSVDIEHVVKVMDIAYRNKYKIVLATNLKMNSSKQNKNKAWIIGTLLFHSLLVLLFFYTGLSYTIPPPPEEGITINFGTTEFPEGETESQQEIFEEIIEETQEVISIDETITQESIETIESEKEDKEKKERIVEETEIKEEKLIKEKKVINKKKIFNPNKNTGNEGVTQEMVIWEKKMEIQILHIIVEEVGLEMDFLK